MPVIAIIDDDPGVLEALAMLLQGKGFSVACYRSAAEFLDAPWTEGCIVSDVRMPGLNGLELLQALQDLSDRRPVILLTGHGDIELAVRALKSGAFDFIEKPFDETRFVEAIDLALKAGERVMAEHRQIARLRKRYASLSDRQREVMGLIIAGCSNKEVAGRLGISMRTVETYRAWVMEKMQARTIADLVHIAIRLGRSGGPGPGEAAPRGDLATSKTPEPSTSG